MKLDIYLAFCTNVSLRKARQANGVLRDRPVMVRHAIDIAEWQDVEYPAAFSIDGPAANPPAGKFIGVPRHDLNNCVARDGRFWMEVVKDGLGNPLAGMEPEEAFRAAVFNSLLTDRGEPLFLDGFHATDHELTRLYPLHSYPAPRIVALFDAKAKEFALHKGRIFQADVVPHYVVSTTGHPNIEVTTSALAVPHRNGERSGVFFFLPDDREAAIAKYQQTERYSRDFPEVVAHTSLKIPEQVRIRQFDRACSRLVDFLQGDNTSWWWHRLREEELLSAMDELEKAVPAEFAKKRVTLAQRVSAGETFSGVAHRRLRLDKGDPLEEALTDLEVQLASLNRISPQEPTPEPFSP